MICTLSKATMSVGLADHCTQIDLGSESCRSCPQINQQAALPLLNYRITTTEVSCEFHLRLASHRQLD